MTLPELTDESRRKGREAGLVLRQARAEIKAQLRSQGRERASLLLDALSLPETRGMKVYDLLVCLPYIGHKRAAELLDKAGIPRDNTNARCGPNQISRLLELLRKSPGH